MVYLKKWNFKQWSDVVLTHLSDENLLSYLYNKVPIPDTHSRYMIWKGFRARVYGVIFEHINDEDLLDSLCHF